jgi:hypothetical protein
MRNIETKQDNIGDELSAPEWNSDQDEFENVVTETYQTLDPGAGPDTDLNMLGKAIALYAAAGNFYQDSGAANAYVLSRTTTLQNIPSYRSGVTVTFKASAVNTGASTINVASLGVKNLTQYDGTPLDAGHIATNDITTAIYNATNDRFEIVGKVDTQFASGTSMWFDNSTAPIGWTRKTSYTNKSMLCYAATGVPGTGGSVNPQSTHTHTGPSHTHTLAHTHSMQSHTHSMQSHTHAVGNHTHGLNSHTHNIPISDWGAMLGNTTGRLKVGHWAASADWEALIDRQSGAASGNTSSGGASNTGAASSASTGAASSASTGAASNSTSSSGGTGNTGANTAPLYVEGIIATKD